MKQNTANALQSATAKQIHDEFYQPARLLAEAKREEERPLPHVTRTGNKKGKAGRRK